MMSTELLSVGTRANLERRDEERTLDGRSSLVAKIFVIKF